MRINRKARATFAALAVLGGTVAGGVATAGPAAAATSCANALSYDFYDSSGHLAAIGYYANSGLSMCAQLVAQGAYYGESKWMETDLNDGAGHTYIVDQGYYSYYAGPITHPEPGYPVCPEAHFQMDDSGGHQILNYTTHVYCD